jgi:hypothetical protein
MAAADLPAAKWAHRSKIDLLAVGLDEVLQTKSTTFVQSAKSHQLVLASFKCPGH